MSAQIIPITPNSGNQTLQVTLSVDGGVLKLQLTLAYNAMAGYWVMTIADNSGNLILDSIPLVTGAYPAANVLEQFAYLAIGSAFIINASGVAQDHPDSTNLGSDFLLLWDDTPPN